MRAESLPTKTEDGQRELAQRTRGLGQRHRTVLLLVDGRRSRHEVLRQAQAAGVGAQVFDDLVAMGLVTAGAAAIAVDVPLDVPGDTSLLPPARSLLPESAWNPLDSVPSGPGLARPIEEARQLMIKAVRREAPVAGALTLVKLKMARNREDLVGLLDEVEQRLAKPRRLIIAAQTMRHVRHLLTLVESTASVPGV